MQMKATVQLFVNIVKLNLCIMTFKPGIKKGSKNYQIIKYMQKNPTIHPE